MSEFNELIKNFEKIRAYLKDFYIFGFKSRNDFNLKSKRTYDNEKRRIESYMGEYMKSGYKNNEKNYFISINCSKISVNPLYKAWKSKSFTSNDIILHFYILDILKKTPDLSITEITDRVAENSELIIDSQLIRNKCKEYVENEILFSKKLGKTLYYSLSKNYFENYMNKIPNLIDSIKFFQATVPLGEIGSFILDNENIKNDIFHFKHNYISYTLDDEILLILLEAINKNLEIEIEYYTSKSTSILKGCPIKIFTNVEFGRRYLCLFNPEKSLFRNYRIDHFKKVNILEKNFNIKNCRKTLDKCLKNVWSVSIINTEELESILLKLYIDEKKESFVLERVKREGKGGTIFRDKENVFVYENSLYDSNEILPWIKTFIGRIIKFECSNETVQNKLYRDIKALESMYL